MTLPVTSQNFWRQRILQTLATGRDLHTVIYDIDPATWKTIQNSTAGILNRHCSPGIKLLDAGCGYGAMYDGFCQYGVLRLVQYTGIDLSQDLIDLGKVRHPNLDLRQGDLLHLPYGDDHFDIVVCRSVRDMLLENNLDDEWLRIHTELRRVGQSLLLLEYDNLDNYTLEVKNPS